MTGFAGTGPEEEAMAGGEAEGPPDRGEGTPHAFLGMVDEFTVEG